MASRVSRIYGGTACVTCFEFDERALEDSLIHTRIFEAPSKEWALFVIHNRNRDYGEITSIECNLDNKYDLVVGPIANDDLALLFRQFSNGMIGVETLVKEMKFKKLTNQYSFHSDKALRYLMKAGVINE